jgi:dienelactone hydrolase
MLTQREVRISVAGDGARLASDSELAVDADLAVPDGGRGVVVFAHGTGSSRHSPRNRMVAGHLHEHGFATLLLDLLTPEEEQVDLRTADLRFDVELLASRLASATRWLRDQAELDDQPDVADLARRQIGYFGASTGAAAALIAAAEEPRGIGAIVSRGGRPDLAGDRLRRVACPTLLIVGGADTHVLALNREALAQLTAANASLEVVAGATHLFEERGALDAVADLAARWFTNHLAGGHPTGW